MAQVLGAGRLPVEVADSLRLARETVNANHPGDVIVPGAYPLPIPHIASSPDLVPTGSRQAATTEQLVDLVASGRPVWLHGALPETLDVTSPVDVMWGWDDFGAVMEIGAPWRLRNRRSPAGKSISTTRPNSCPGAALAGKNEKLLVQNDRTGALTLFKAFEDTYEAYLEWAGIVLVRRAGLRARIQGSARSAAGPVCSRNCYKGTATWTRSAADRAASAGRAGGPRARARRGLRRGPYRSARGKLLLVPGGDGIVMIDFEHVFAQWATADLPVRAWTDAVAVSVYVGCSGRSRAGSFRTGRSTSSTGHQCSRPATPSGSRTRNGWVRSVRHCGGSARPLRTSPVARPSSSGPRWPRRTTSSGGLPSSGTRPTAGSGALRPTPNRVGTSGQAPSGSPLAMVPTGLVLGRDALPARSEMPGVQPVGDADVFGAGSGFWSDVLDTVTGLAVPVAAVIGLFVAVLLTKPLAYAIWLRGPTALLAWVGRLVRDGTTADQPNQGANRPLSEHFPDRYRVLSRIGAAFIWVFLGAAVGFFVSVPFVGVATAGVAMAVVPSGWSESDRRRSRITLQMIRALSTGSRGAATTRLAEGIDATEDDIRSATAHSSQLRLTTDGDAVVLLPDGLPGGLGATAPAHEKFFVDQNGKVHAVTRGEFFIGRNPHNDLNNRVTPGHGKGDGLPPHGRGRRARPRVHHRPQPVGVPRRAARRPRRQLAAGRPRFPQRHLRQQRAGCQPLAGGR